MIETGRPRQSWNGWGSRPCYAMDASGRTGGGTWFRSDEPLDCENRTSVVLGDLYLITEGAAAIFSR